jgi:hypothetical protein
MHTSLISAMCEQGFRQRHRFLVRSIITTVFSAWLLLFLKGKRFALRDRLRQANAIVVLAGTRGHLAFLDGKFVQRWLSISKDWHR